MKKQNVFSMLLNSIKNRSRALPPDFTDDVTQAEQVSLLKKQTEFLRHYPVSPYFAQKVLVLANSRKREEFWFNLQLLSGPIAKFALFSLILIIALVFVPGNNNGNTITEDTSTDAITIIYNNDASINEIKTDEQALKFALLY